MTYRGYWNDAWEALPRFQLADGREGIAWVTPSESSALLLLASEAIRARLMDCYAQTRPVVELFLSKELVVSRWLCERRRPES
jgi:hypothetical protein